MTTFSFPDLSACDREPIHVPGSIQPHGVLLALTDDGRVMQASANASSLLGHATVVGVTIGEFLNQDAGALRAKIFRAPVRHRPALLTTLTLADSQIYNAVAHRADEAIILEFEREPDPHSHPDMYAAVDAFASRAESVNTLRDLCQIAAADVRVLTGFDRVIVYAFDENWNGTVLGEAGSDRLPSVLEHRFPASDIPAQAREMYRHNRLRMIPDAEYRPVPITPLLDSETRRPLDLTFSVLRSVSPVHVEYMRNMETRAAMSVSILREGRLWGLISCHHRDAKLVPYTIRTTCDLLARSFSLRLAALEHSRDYERRIGVGVAYARLLSGMADKLDFATGLGDRADDLMAFAEANGAAIVTEGRCQLIGTTPTETDVRGLSEWIFNTVRKEVWSSDALPDVYSPANAFKDTASGILAISVSQLHPGYVLWFRPELIQTIQWGGDPKKAVEPVNGDERPSPRKSFATWRETVKGKSQPWRPADLEAAAELRNAIVGVILRRAEQLAELNSELERSNKELEAFSYSVSHDLRAPLRHVVGYAEMLRDDAGDTLSDRGKRCVNTIIESSEFAGTLVDKLLAFSRLGRGQLNKTRIDINLMISELRRESALTCTGRTIVWRVHELPPGHADMLMLRLVFQNLIDNALKYTRMRDEAIIEISGRQDHRECVYTVRDNGVGFDMKYIGKLFGVFQRLHRMEEFEGTGIGLANVRRIVERHGGRVWAEGQPEHGAAFSFSLPHPSGEGGNRA